MHLGRALFKRFAWGGGSVNRVARQVANNYPLELIAVKDGHLVWMLANGGTVRGLTKLSQRLSVLVNWPE